MKKKTPKDVKNIFMPPEGQWATQGKHRLGKSNADSAHLVKLRPGWCLREKCAVPGERCVLLQGLGVRPKGPGPSARRARGSDRVAVLRGRAVFGAAIQALVTEHGFVLGQMDTAVGATGHVLRRS